MATGSVDLYCSPAETNMRLPTFLWPFLSLSFFFVQHVATTLTLLCIKLQLVNTSDYSGSTNARFASIFPASVIKVIPGWLFIFPTQAFQTVFWQYFGSSCIMLLLIWSCMDLWECVPEFRRQMLTRIVWWPHTYRCISIILTFCFKTLCRYIKITLPIHYRTRLNRALHHTTLRNIENIVDFSTADFSWILN